jgi:selenocysteine-specific elongation factor
MEELRAGLPYAIHPRVFREIAEGLEQQGKLRKMESLVSLTSHQVKLGIAEVGLAQAVLTRLEQDPLSPPDLKQIAADLGQPGKLFEVIRLLENEGKIVRVTQDLCFKVEALHRAKTLLLENLEQKSEISAAAFRTLIGSSRKYAISLLEYFDRQGLTLRVGDVRRLRASKIRAG